MFKKPRRNLEMEYSVILNISFLTRRDININKIAIYNIQST